MSDQNRVASKNITFPVSNITPGVRGERMLSSADKVFSRITARLNELIPLDANPLAQTGGIANTTFIMALITGVLLLFWYTPSVSGAFASVAAMERQWWGGGLVRSLHRYSSDACLLFVILHALKILFARRFLGARWVAWTSGVILLWLLWLDGWLGYWLIWDVRSKYIARGSAKLLEALPIFADPLSRSFLTDEVVNSLFFFVVFFFHMLIPLGMGLLIWVHVSRLSEPRLFAGKRLTIYIVLTLVFLSLAFPARSAEKAAMRAHDQSLALDLLFMAPIYLMERLSGGAVFTIAVILTALLISFPWSLGRKRKVAPHVLESRCSGCTQCYQDCPFTAIRMVPGDNKAGIVARIDPLRCTQCGICVGACDPAGIVFPLVPVIDSRKHIDKWLESSTLERPFIAFACSNSAALELRIDQATGLCDELPGYHVLPVSCTGWIHPVMLERAVRHKAAGILIVGCGPEDPYFRRGVALTIARLSSERKPSLREQQLKGVPVRYLHFGASDKHEFLKAAADFREGRITDIKRERRSVLMRAAAGITAAAIFSALILILNYFPFTPEVPKEARLIVSFKHPGRVEERILSAEEQESGHRLAHMRQTKSVSRTRAPVRLKVIADGKVLIEKSFAPRGIFNDGNSIALEELMLVPGKHRISVSIGESLDVSEWSFNSERELTFERLEDRVVLFDKREGFRWF